MTAYARLVLLVVGSACAQAQANAAPLASPDRRIAVDIAAAAIAFDNAKLHPGHAAWSRALLKDDGTYFDIQKRFVDYAADMGWEHALVDADRDRKIGDARLRDMGVKGVKVDFFAGDGKSMIAYYVDMLTDAAEAGMLVNFHGATLPRGWSRTFPNLMTVEAVKGFALTAFERKDQDAMPLHAAMPPFSRKLFDPMDYTLDGYPGRHPVIARKSGDSRYVAGFNADGAARTVELDLSFLDGRSGTLVADGDGDRDFSQSLIGAGKQSITIEPRGGFVAVSK